MTGRITTRAGREIRHVTPGYVVDVATDASLFLCSAVGGLVAVYGPGAPDEPGYFAASAYGIDAALAEIASAEAACALVRVMLAIGG